MITPQIYYNISQANAIADLDLLCFQNILSKIVHFMIFHVDRAPKDFIAW